jgi:hypothetical protein
MTVSSKRVIYHGVCACIALGIAAYAILPVSAATASALGYRGGQSCEGNGCHNQATTCGGSSSCTEQKANACLSGPNDNNNKHCGADSGLCTNLGCSGADVQCR